MNPAEQIHYYYPNKMGRIILLAMEEILGRTGMNAIFNVAGCAGYTQHLPPDNFDKRFSFAQLAKLQNALEELYGPRSGHGLALRSGRACFKYGLREFGPELGLSEMPFRLLPIHDKISQGAAIFAEFFNRFTDQQVHIVEDDVEIYWHIDRCPVCWGRKATQPVCHLAVGILDEALYWVSGGKHFHIEETSCIAKGDASCTIEIQKKPFE